MATHLKKTQQGLVAEAKLVAATARKYFDGFRAADVERKRKLLPESRLRAFEAAIARLEGAIGGRMVASSKQLSATQAEGQRRSRLYDVLRELREEVKLGLPEEVGVGQAFGVGTRMSRNSTPRVLRVARGVLASWAQEGFREAVMEIGITGARMASVRVLTEELEKAQTDQDGMCRRARGKTISKGAQLEKVQREMVYVRRVARFVFREQPAVLATFAGTMRGPVKRRVARTGVAEGDGSGSVARGSRRAARRRRGGAGLPKGAAQARRGEEGERQGQDESFLRQEGSFPRQEGSSAGQRGSSLRQEGPSLRQEGSSLRQEGSSLRQEGSFLKKAGSFSRESAVSPPVGGAAPRERRRRRR